MKTLGLIGPAAGAALPLLRKLRSGMQYAAEAEQAILKINGSFDDGPADPFEIMGGSTSAGNASLPRYDGSTLEEWLVVLKTDRKTERLQEALDAVSQLADAAQAENISASIFGLLQRHETSMHLGGMGDELLVDAGMAGHAEMALRELPPSIFVKGLLNHLVGESKPLQQFAFWVLLQLTRTGGGGAGMEDPLHRELKQHQSTLMTNLVKLAASPEWKTRVVALKILLRYCTAERISFSAVNDLSQRIDDGLRDVEPRVRTAIIKELHRAGAPSDRYITVLIQMLASEKDVDVRTARTAFYESSVWNGIVQIIVQRFEKLYDRVGRQSAVSSEDKRFLHSMFRALSAMGPAARDALPTLRKFTSNTEFQRAAERVIAKIED
jgi:hypothetical protein